MPAIVVDHLTKSFDSYNRRSGVLGAVRDLVHRDHTTVTAVDAISFTVETGELLGYIGPNGAGKSTSIKMLTGILKPTSGKLEVLGFHPYFDRKRYAAEIGVVFGQRTQLWWDIAAVESFRLLGRIYDIPDSTIEERLKLLSDVLDLHDVLKTPVRKLSLGQRMKCDLAASLIHNPKILFLDEPTIGLDAVAKDSIRTFLRRINKELGTTILLTTHDLKEIEELCQRILVLDHGKVIYDGTLAAIKALPGLTRSLQVDFHGDIPLEQLNQLFPEKVLFRAESGRRVHAEYDPSVVTTSELLRNVLANFTVGELTVIEPDIEQVIMKIYREGV
jgi:ABC-2 type transport system ATP-binding protein